MEGEVVGGVGIAPFNEQAQVCELQKLYLSPKAQGLGLSKEANGNRFVICCSTLRKVLFRNDCMN